MLKNQVAAAHKFDKHFLTLSGGDKSNRKFSHFVELEKNPGAQFALKEKQISMDEFAKWVQDDKFRMAINVRDLKEIIEHPEAFEAFKNNGYDAAKEFLLTDDEIDLSEVDGKKLSEELRKRIDAIDIQSVVANKEYVLSLLNLGTATNAFWDAAQDLGYKRRFSGLILSESQQHADSVNIIKDYVYSDDYFTDFIRA